MSQARPQNTYQSVVRSLAQLNIRQSLGDQAGIFLREIALANYSRTRLLSLVLLFIFGALLLLDIVYLIDGKWAVSPGYKLLYFGHCAILGLLFLAILIHRLKPAHDPAEVTSFHRIFVGLMIFLFMLNLIFISLGDVLATGSVVAYLGTIFAVAAIFVLTNLYCLALYLFSMLTMVQALFLIAERFGLAMQIEIVNVVSFSIVAAVLSRVMFFYKLNDFKNRQLIECQRHNLEELATKDPLTKAFNRRKFQELLHNEIALANRTQRTFSLAMFDLDHFKVLNDTYGHVAGDKVLQFMSTLVQNNIRSTDSLVRWGGEEFIILAPDTQAPGMAQVSEKLRRIFEDHHMPDCPTVTASFGVTEFVLDEPPEALIQRVDQALYTAKANGRNNVEVSLKA